MTIKINNISIQSFRGIIDTQIELKGKSLVILGENGSGKSSIVDAIEFFFTGGVSHLKGIQGLSLKKHAANVNSKLKDIKIEMNFYPDNKSLVKTYTTNPSPPKRMRSFFDTTQKGTFILRRSQMLQFVISLPKERYDTVATLIGIESLNSTELEMKKLLDETQVKIDSLESQKKREMQKISKNLGKKAIKSQEILNQLNLKLKLGDFPSIDSIHAIDGYKEELLKSVKKDRKNLARDRFYAELTELQKLLIKSNLLTRFKELNDRITDLLEEENTQKLEYHSLLKLGRTLIETNKLTNCPLCKQEINRNVILSEIENRIRIITELSENASHVRKGVLSAINEIDTLYKLLRKLYSKIKINSQFNTEAEQLKRTIEYFKNFSKHLLVVKDLKNLIPIQEFGIQLNKANTLVSTIFEKSNKLREEEKLSTQEKKALDYIQLLGDVRTSYSELELLTPQLLDSKRIYYLSEKIYTTFVDTKKKKIQEIFDTIQKDIERYYLIIHPNDLHKNIELLLSKLKRASINLAMETFGKPRQDPRGLTSEGHLDSLGLCVFLAFVKNFNTECPLIILDDVVTTIDANHREKICKVLIEEFPDKQLIITTHDEVWYDQLRKNQHAYKVDSKFKNLEIIHWNLNEGPRISSYAPRWEKIQKKIADGDKSAGSDGRIYFEWILKKMCHNTGTPIPYNKIKVLTVGDLFEPLKKQLMKLAKDTKLEESLNLVFIELERTKSIWNLLSHDNPLSKKVALVEVQFFCETVHKFHESLLCSECKKFLKYYQDIGLLLCSTGKCAKKTLIQSKN